jgi:GPI-anchor transamidase subunit GAA1
MENAEKTSAESLEHHGLHSFSGGSSVPSRHKFLVPGIPAGTHPPHFLAVSSINTFFQPLSLVFYVAVFILPLGTLAAVPGETSTTQTAPLSRVLNALNLCLASTVISITTVLNFSLAATLAAILGLSLSFASPPQRFLVGLGKYSAFVWLGFGWLLWAPEETRKAIWHWEVLGVWFAPFVCIVYAPLVLQAGVACLLPP